MLRLLVCLLLLAGATSTAKAARHAQTFKSDRISVEVRGVGPDVILIPGLCSHPEIWHPTVTAVPGYRYHLVQLAGFAGKPAGPNASGPLFSPVAEELARYIRQSHLNHPAIVGHSLGGTLAMMIAARHPGLISRLMVVDMFPFVGLMNGPPGTTSESIRPTAEKMRDQFGTKSGAEKQRAIEKTVATMTHDEAWRPRLVQHALGCDVAVGREAFYEILVTDLRPELRKIKVPILVLWQYPPGVSITRDQLDQSFRQSYANAPQAVVKQIPGAWHFIMLDQPRVFQRELRQFLSHRRGG